MTVTCVSKPDTLPQADSAPETSLLAGFRERLAAALLDVLIVSTLMTALSLVVMHFSARTWESLVRLWASQNSPWLTAAVSAAVLLSVMTFLFEWGFNATPGRQLCRLRVKTLSHARCGFIGALVRAVLRPVDLLFGPVMILTSPGRQRLGDRIAGTTVVLAQRTASARSSMSADPPVFASWEERTRASIVDWALLLAFSAASLTLLGALKLEWPIVLRLDLLTVLLLVQLWWWYFLLFEALAGGTVGKRVCGLAVSSLDAARPRFVSGVLRTLCYPANAGSFGILPFVLIRCTRKRQNAGDLLASSVVCRVRRS